MEVRMRVSGSAVPRIVAAAVLFASFVASGCASARSSDEEPAKGNDFARSGAYIGLYGIESYEDFHTTSDSVHAGNSDLGIGAKVGYRISPNIAVEGIAEDVKGFKLSDGNADTDLDLMNFGVMGKYYMLTDRIQPYLLLGAGLARADVRDFNYDHDGGFLRGGLGADFYLTENFALFGEANYNRMMGGVSELHHIDLQFGLIFRF
jgi:opacity protein-like surface antigen